MRKKRSRYLFGSALLSAAMLASSVPSTILPAMANEDDASTGDAEKTGQLSTVPAKTEVQFIDSGERTVDFDADWSFHLGEASGAEQPLFDDSKWDIVNVPHDYSITQDYDSTLEGESGYKPGGIGWYRKSFVLSENVENKRIRIDFDGVYMNSTVYINGHKLGDHPYGYTPFSYDLTDYINKEGENVISVRVDHRTPSSRWYSGSGITRDVKMTLTEDVHVDLFGTKVTSPKLEEQKNGAVDTVIAAAVVNSGEEAKTVTVRQSIFKKGSSEAAASQTGDPVAIDAGETKTVEQTVAIQTPDLWTTTAPNLYTIRTEILEDGAVVDSYDTEYGYRYFKFDKDNGFSLNGESMKLNGVCMHHDQGALGSVDTRRAVERQVEILKGMGVNSIRTSHNPGSETLHEVCAEQGILLMEEFFDGWSTEKNGNSEDYHNYFLESIPEDSELLHADLADTWAQFDLQETMRRGRNNPSVIIWDIGNEIEHGNTAQFPEICDNILSWITAMDDRPMVLGDNKTLFNATPVSNQLRDKINAAGGLIGSNYGLAPNLQTLFRNDHPDWLFTGTENVSAVNSRGIYDRIGSQADKNNDRQLTSYDLSAVSWGHRASQAMIGFVENDWFAGEYVWTGFDYIGEPTPWNGISAGPQGGWPSPKNSYFGIVDTAGFEKDTYYFYRSIWKQDDTTLHILPAWKDGVVYKDGNGKVPVVVYSNAHKVKLEFTDTAGNTTTIGEKEFTEKTTANGYKWRIYEGADKDGTRDKNLYLTWQVPYADGTITATAYDVSGNVIEKTVGRKSVTTFGDAASLDAKADRTEITADGKDLTYIAVNVRDANGNEVANAADRVTFTVEGEGTLVGVDNGNSIDHQSYQDDNRNAFSGKVLAIVQSTEKNGTIKVTASADGLTSSTVTINTSGAKAPQVQAQDSTEFSKGCYLRAGTQPELPETITLTYEDGTVKENVPVTWEAIPAGALNKSGTVTVNGLADGQKVSYYINVIDQVGAVQNYSTVTTPGTKVDLPESRPVLTEDGNKLPIFAPVTWEAIPESAWNTPGIITVKGTADVLGESFSVQATIRVKEATVQKGANVVPTLGYRVLQDIPEAQQSDTLLAIKDGDRTTRNESGTNSSIWSNYTAAQSDNKHAEITIYLDTAQNLSEADIYFCKDSWSIEYPEAGSVKIEVSETGEDGTWRELTTTESIGEETTHGDCTIKTKCYTYTFDPVQATVVRFSFDALPGSTGNAKICAGISEIEMYPVTPILEQGTSTALASLVINGKDEGFVNTSESKLRSTAKLFDTIEAVGADNASVTVLEPEGNTVKLVVESEDHSATRIVTVEIQKPYIRDAEDDAYDLPTTGLTASSPTVYPGTGNEGPVSHVLDGNTNTYYHSNWNNDSGSKLENRHIDLTFDTPTEVAALRYLPRNTGGDGGQNGQIVSYQIQYQETEGGEWIDIAEGSWEPTTGWKVAEFDRPVTAKAVRLIGVHTKASDGSDLHMTATELRLCKDMPKAALEEVEGFEVQWPESIGDTIYADSLDLHDQIPVDASKDLYYGTDYYFTYDLDPANNEVTVTLHGYSAYSGEVSKTYKVKSIVSIDTSLLELTIAAGDSLSEEAELYTGIPALSTALSKGKAALSKKESQAAVNAAAENLNQALLDVRRIPDAGALDELK